MHQNIRLNENTMEKWQQHDDEHFDVKHLVLVQLCEKVFKCEDNYIHRELKYLFKLKFSYRLNSGENVCLVCSLTHIVRPPFYPSNYKCNTTLTGSILQSNQFNE